LVVFGESCYAVITGDLVASREAPPAERRDIQVVTLELLEELGRELEADLVLPFGLHRGDEVQALLRRPSRVPVVLQRFKDRFFGATTAGKEVAFGVGWGPLSTGLLPKATSVGQLDGPCFHRARAMLDRARKEHAWALFDGFERQGWNVDKPLNSLFELMAAIRSSWTPTQSRIAVEMRSHAKRIDLAAAMGVNPSVITKSLQASRYDAILRGEAAATALLAEFDPTDGAAAQEADGA